jgi:hypothetical protein
MLRQGQRYQFQAQQRLRLPIRLPEWKADVSKSLYRTGTPPKSMTVTIAALKQRSARSSNDDV